MSATELRDGFLAAYNEAHADPEAMLENLWAGVGFLLGARHFGAAAALVVCHEHMFPEGKTPDLILDLIGRGRD